MKISINLSTHLLFLLILGNLTFAQGVKPADSNALTVEDLLLKQERMMSVSISPNNKMVVWLKRKAVKKKDAFVTNIYLTRLDTKKDGTYRTIPLTHGDDNDYSPIFSKDNEFIYFLSSREEGKKLWKMSIWGGEAKAIKTFKHGISNIQWKDSETLLFHSSDGKSLYEQQNEKNKDNVVVVEDSVHWTPSHVYAMNVKDLSVERITDNKKTVSTSVVSPDGKWLFYSILRSKSYGSDAQQDPYYYLKNLETGYNEQIISDRGFPISNIQFSKDSKGFYFSSSYSSDPQWNGAGIEEIFYFNVSTKNYKKVDLKWELGAGGGFIVAGNDIIVLLSNRTTFKAAYFEKRGNQWKKLPFNLKEKNDHIGIHTISDDGSKIIYTHSTTNQLPIDYIASLKFNKVSEETLLVRLNKHLKDKELVKSEVIKWAGYKGEEVTGVLYYPKDYQEGKKYPLMLSIHGGPASATLDRWREGWGTYPNILAQKGMFVLKPNYHGSNNHGLAYVESIKGNYYEPELEDITKGIELLINEGKVDRSKLGTMGWSNGAIITTMLTVRYPDMFKVAAAGAGDVNWTSDFGTCGFGVQFDQSYFGGAPWDDTNGKFYNENYLIKSPLFEMEKVKTPTIIFHGSEDRAVPRDQGWEYYRALQQIGKAPVKFLWFPGQPHGLRKITHQTRKVKEEIAWIEQFLLGASNDKNESFKEDSPLAKMLKLQKASIENGLYGNNVNGVLFPEVVALKKDSISIGRFEVTNAQYKAFKNDHSFKSGEDNFPVEVNKADALQYLAWLSEKSGIKYRLPNSKEGKALHQIARKVANKENTLNFWAGYPLTKEDVGPLMKKVNELKTTLLQSVGTRKGVKVGETFLYDVGGNLAEFAEEGTYGYSAYDFFDANQQKFSGQTHVGFRVVKE